MANITLSTSLVVSPGAKFFRHEIGSALINVGQLVYRNAANKLVEAQANDATAAPAIGIVTAAPVVDGGPAQVCFEGTLTSLSGLTTGEIYVLSDSSAGDIMPYSDLAATDYVTLVGIALSATSLKVKFFATGVQYGGTSTGSIAIPTTGLIEPGATIDRVSKTFTPYAAGIPVYKNSAQQWTAVIGSAEASAVVEGVLVSTTAGAGVAANLARRGVYGGLSGLTTGTIYVVSDSAAGQVMPANDLGTNDWVSIVGFALSAARFRIFPFVGGVQAA